MIFTELQVRNLLSESGFYDRNPEVAKYWAEELAKELTRITEDPIKDFGNDWVRSKVRESECGFGRKS